jgi:hypothetical protein
MAPVCRLAAAAETPGLDAKALLSEPHPYVDRFGEYRAPFDAAMRVAKRCSGVVGASSHASFRERRGASAASLNAPAPPQP